ncbi:hypothetical protein ARMGADRAFT_1169724 [Armillaria gallica]|uniref:Uncharacterized protein n=1 Tax=Armillaria gallica TaxID=47427 RepID=A0A2H3CUJ2_ARMGA|nr:hypothetical protein ARMGADRAFT_1169724 [Armillaria gallica]
MFVEPLRRARLCIFLLRLPPRSLVYLRLHSDAQNHDYPRTRTSFQVAVAGTYSLTLQSRKTHELHYSAIHFMSKVARVAASFLALLVFLRVYTKTTFGIPSPKSISIPENPSQEGARLFLEFVSSREKGTFPPSPTVSVAPRHGLVVLRLFHLPSANAPSRPKATIHLVQCDHIILLVDGSVFRLIIPTYSCPAAPILEFESLEVAPDGSAFHTPTAEMLPLDDYWSMLRATDAPPR